LFAPREVDVEILGIKTSDEFNKIHAKFTQSTKQNGPWFIDYIKANAQPGRPLPYHQNFGITKVEYERYHKLSKDVKLVPVSTGRLRFTEESKGRIVIHGVDGLYEFDDTIIDTNRKQVITRWGTVPLDKPVHVGEESALGSWDGFAGRQQTGSVEDGTFSLVRIDVGRQTKTSLNLLCLSVRVVENGVKTVSVELPVRFP
jgi:hypothetical protein